MKLAIFDLGNVFIKINFLHTFVFWEKRTGVPKEQLAARFQVDTLFMQFERDQISAKEYHKHLCQVLKVPFTYDDFCKGWNAIHEGVIPETRQFIEDLQGIGKVVALTNTNRIHSDFWSVVYQEELDLFSHIYKSFTIGTRKPEAQCYRHVLESESCSPQDACFFDDNLENVEAAKNVGISAYHVEQDFGFIEKFKGDYSHKLAAIGV